VFEIAHPGHVGHLTNRYDDRLDILTRIHGLSASGEDENSLYPRVGELKTTDCFHTHGTPPVTEKES
jgi:hypothetical protein